MHILILNWRDPRNPKSGGAEIVTFEHAKAWIKKGHTVTWFAQQFPQAKQNEIFENIEIIRKGNSLTVILLAPFFYFFSKKKFDVVIDEIHGFPFFTPFYVRNAKIVAFIHEVAGEIWDYMYPFPINILGKLVEKIYFNFYKSITFWTDAQSTIEDLVLYGIPRGNCIAIACPIRLPKYPIKGKKGKELTLIFVSRVVKMKGIERVIDSLSYVVKEYPQAMLWVVGGGNEKYISQLNAEIKKLSLTNNVKFWGRVSDIKKLTLMKKAHILLHASVKEGWGLVVIEAASQGTPAIVYNVAGLKDSVKNNKTGIILKENTPEKMAERAIKVYKDKKLYHLLQKNGIQWAKSLTWESATKQSLKLIEAL